MKTFRRLSANELICPLIGVLEAPLFDATEFNEQAYTYLAHK